MTAMLDEELKSDCSDNEETITISSDKIISRIKLT